MPTTTLLPDPSNFASIGWVIVIIASIVMGIRQGIGLVRELKDKPNPGEVARDSAERYATKVEFQNHIEWNRREHENLYAKIGGVERGITSRIESRLDKMEQSSNEGRDKLHSRINDILAAVSNLEGRLEEKHR